MIRGREGQLAPPMRGAIRAVLVVALIAFALALASCKSREADAAADDAGPVVQVGAENITVVAIDRLEAGPVISGNLTAEREAQIRAEVAGSVLQTLADQGQRVVAGQVLARIDDAALRESQIGARSGVSTAEMSAEIARKELERAQRLHEAGAIAERDLEGARRNATGAAAMLADARARLALANRLLEATMVRAPFSGVVAVRTVSPGDVIAPGAPLFTVVDPSSMRLEAALPADALSTVRLGAPVRFTVSGYADRSFTGTVTRINPSADPVTRQVRIVASIPATGQLVSGLFAEGRVASQSKLAPSVPIAAVDRRGVEPLVLRIRGGKVESVAVQLGMIDEIAERIEITQGVAVGDTLLLGTAQGISAGTSVTVSDPADRARR